MASRPALATVVSVTFIAARALQGLGVPVAAAGRPSVATTVTVTTIAARALQALGLAVTAANRPALTTVVAMQLIADAALQAVGVTVPAALQPPEPGVTTAADVATQALVELGVIALDEAPSATDQALVVDKVGSAHASLVGQGLATWDATAGIPVGVIEEYIKLTALLLAFSFGKTADPLLWAALETRVRKYSQVKQLQGPEILARVALVHDSLVADAGVSWANTAIPQAAFDEYVALTTAQIAPVFGVTIDPATLPPIAARVKRIALIMQGQSLAEARVATVHDELVGNGYASWALNAIPQAVADDYTALVQFQMSNAFDMKADPAGIPAFEARVKRFALVLQAQTLAEARVNAIHDELVGSAHVSWAASAIPQAVSDDYVALAMIKLAPVFEIKADPSGVPVLEARVRHFSPVQRAPALATEAVMAVHADLGARGKLRWTVWDIPQAAEQPMVLLAAFRLGPEFDRQVAPSDVIQAEHALARMIALPTSGERVRAEYF